MARAKSILWNFITLFTTGIVLHCTGFVSGHPDYLVTEWSTKRLKDRGNRRTKNEIVGDL